MKVEQLFEFHQVDQERRVSLATRSFQGPSMYWRTSLIKNLTLNNNPKIRYWNEFRIVLRKCHMPSYYDRELMYKLQRLQQGDMIVEDYRQKMELLILRV